MPVVLELCQEVYKCSLLEICMIYKISFYNLVLHRRMNRSRMYGPTRESRMAVMRGFAVENCR